MVRADILRGRTRRGLRPATSVPVSPEGTAGSSRRPRDAAFAAGEKLGDGASASRATRELSHRGHRRASRLAVPNHELDTSDFDQLHKETLLPDILLQPPVHRIGRPDNVA